MWAAAAGAQTEAERTASSSAPIPALARPGSWKISPMDGAPYSPLGLKQKFYLFNYRTIEPTAFAKSAFGAAIAHATNTPEEWGQGWDAYGHRYGHRLASRGVKNMIGFGAAALLHQDGRYFRRGEGRIVDRLGHSVAQTFVTRTDSGGRTFATYRFVGAYASEFVTNAWRPPSQREPGDTVLRGTVSLGFDAASNVFKEFWPDIKRRVLKR